MAFPYTLTIPYCLPLIANIGSDPVFGTTRRGFISEFECELSIDYEDIDNWAVVEAIFDKTGFADGFIVSATSDSTLWKLIDRALEYDWKDLSDRVRQAIIDAERDREDGRGDYLHDLRAEAM